MNRGVPVWLVKNWSEVEGLPWDEPGSSWAYQEVGLDWGTFLQMCERDILEKTDAEKVQRNRNMWSISQEVADYVTREKAEKFGYE